MEDRSKVCRIYQGNTRRIALNYLWILRENRIEKYVEFAQKYIEKYAEKRPNAPTELPMNYWLFYIQSGGEVCHDLRRFIAEEVAA